MKIVADENISRVVETFSRWGDVATLPGRRIAPEHLQGADVLLVRSVTRVDEALLAHSNIRFVGTATIGLDHIDQAYLRQRGIALAHAPGCNAGAVVQYVFSVLANCRPDWRDCQIGIIGCGNVGGRLDRLLAGLGVATCCYDPFLRRSSNPRLTALRNVLQADIVCLHTPLTREGPHPTWHMLSERQLAALRPGTTLINAGRGGAIDNRALVKAIDKRQLQVALDVWEDEPDISLALLDKVQVATPHIAGYSREGKLAGTQMVYQAFCRWAGAPEMNQIDESAPPKRITATTLNSAILRAYDVTKDDRAMRDALYSAPGEAGICFDRLRKNYPRRREFGHFAVDADGLSVQLRRDLTALGFV